MMRFGRSKGPEKRVYSSAVLFLHAEGDTGDSVLEAVERACPSYMLPVCPTAPSMPVTVVGKSPMHAWFDIICLSRTKPEDTAGIRRSANLVHLWLDIITKNFKPSRVVIGGIGQGGALALYSALTYHKTLAGISVFSCWLPAHKDFPQAMSANNNIPMWISHGKFNSLVPYKWGEFTASFLSQFVRPLVFTPYENTTHKIDQMEGKDLKTFLAFVVPPLPSTKVYTEDDFEEEFFE